MRSEGLTLVELLVGIAILVIVMMVTFQLSLQSSQVYEMDKERLSSLSNLQAGFSLLEADIREAGELLPSVVPAVRVYTASAAQGGGDVLKLLRGLSDTYLPLCGTTPPTGTGTLPINRIVGTVTFPDGSNNMPAACSNSGTAASAWEAVRLAKVAAGQGNTVRATMVDVTGKSAYEFDVTGLDGNGNLVIKNMSPAVTLDSLRPNSSATNRDVRLYLVEARTYWLQDGDIYLDIDSQGGQKAIPHATAFDVTPLLRSTGGAASLPFGDPLATPGWRSLSGIKVEAAVKEKKRERRASETLLPRNSLSNDQ